MKRKWRCDLEFWMNAYDRAIEEHENAIDDNEWYHEHIGRPYSDRQKQEIIKLYSRIKDTSKLRDYIRERILRYNI